MGHGPDHGNGRVRNGCAAADDGALVRRQMPHGHRLCREIVDHGKPADPQIPLQCRN